MLTRKQAREKQFQLFGWVLFLGCSILFIIASIVSGSPWGLAASIIFLFGCVLFIIPLTWKQE